MPKIGGGVGFKIDGEKSDGTTAPHTGNVPSGTGGSDASGRQDAVVASWKQWIVDKIPDLPDIPYDMNDIKIASLVVDVTQHFSKKEPGAEVRPEGLVLVDRLLVEMDSLNERRVHGRLVNNAPAALSHVRVDILFLSSQGETLVRRGVNPLVVSGGLFGDKSAPLGPADNRVFRVDASQVPKEWTGGLKAEVIEFRFSK